MLIKQFDRKFTSEPGQHFRRSCAILTGKILILQKYSRLMSAGALRMGESGQMFMLAVERFYLQPR